MVRKIRFFEDKTREFVWTMLPLFGQMRLYKKDILYAQGDPSDDVFFIIMGRVKFFWKKPMSSDQYREKGKLPEPPEPINLHVEGSYFGDNDVLVNGGRDGRDSTAIAETDGQLLVITKG